MAGAATLAHQDIAVGVVTVVKAAYLVTAGSLVRRGTVDGAGSQELVDSLVGAVLAVPADTADLVGFLAKAVTLDNLVSVDGAATRVLVGTVVGRDGQARAVIAALQELQGTQG